MKGSSFTLLFVWLCTPTIFAQTATENFVLARTYKNAGMTELNGGIYAGTPATVSTQIGYLDGLGKATLGVAVAGSPTQKDLSQWQGGGGQFRAYFF